MYDFLPMLKFRFFFSSSLLNYQFPYCIKLYTWSTQQDIVGHLASEETVKWRLQIQFWLQASNNTGILNTCIRLWLTESEQATPVDSI